jgi:hypothetical protein
MRLNISDPEELVLKCQSAQSRGYIAEAVECYHAGAYRACIVSTWIAVVFDFVDKLNKLELAGDKNAQEKLSEFNDIREKGDVARSLKFERQIIDWALNEFELISPLEHRDLTRLVEDRHRCAHPSMSSSDELYQPTAELARYHLRNAVEYLLQHPPAQGKAALSRIMEEINGSLFPRNKDAALQHFRFGPLARPRPALVRNVVIVLVKQCLHDALEPDSRLRRAAALNAIRTMHREPTEQALREKLNEVARGVPDTLLLRLVLFLASVDDCWHFLAEDVIGRIERYSSNIPEAELPAALSAILRVPALEQRAKAQISTLSAPELSLILGQVVLLPEMLDRAVELYGESGSFDTANTRANNLIIPLASSFTPEQVTRLVESVSRNSQISGSFRAPVALKTIRDNNPGLTPQFWDDLVARVGFDDLKSNAADAPTIA